MQRPQGPRLTRSSLAREMPCLFSGLPFLLHNPREGDSPRTELPMSSRPQAAPHVHISEPHVRVTEWRFAPGAETGWRRHEAGITDYGDSLLNPFLPYERSRR